MTGLISNEYRAELIRIGVERVGAERVAQGLPPKVEDPASYERVGILMRRPADAPGESRLAS